MERQIEVNGKVVTVEVSFARPRYSSSCGRHVPGGYEANVIGAEDFGVDRIYSQRSETVQDALDDVAEQIRRYMAPVPVS